MTPSGPPRSPQNHDFPRPASTGRRQFPRNASHSDDKPRPAHLNFRYLTTYTNRGNVLVATNHHRRATGTPTPQTFARRCTARALHTPPRRDVTAAPRPSRHRRAGGQITESHPKRPGAIRNENTQLPPTNKPATHPVFHKLISTRPAHLNQKNRFNETCSQATHRPAKP